ncbi:MAG: hypothetical protein M3O07_09830 [Pseudomonadota bacterium]|nr:hypothetical protein [Pseudomonadota bacterium]
MTTKSGRTPLVALLLGLILGFSSQAFGQGADFCWSETWGRGASMAIPTVCGVDQEKNGALCYPKCQAGYVSDGVAGCIQSCPAGARDDGLFCGWASYKAAEYPAWDAAKCRANHPTGCWQTVPTIGVWVENCRAGYKHVVGFCEISELNCPAMGLAGNRIANSCAKKHYFRDTALPACGSGKEYDAGLCYDACKDGADGVGPVCWAKGPPGWVQCGAGWAATQAICDQNIAQQVISVVDAAVTSTMLIGSLGATAAISTGAKASTTVFKKAAWEGVKKIGKAGVQNVLLSTAKATAIGAATSVPDAILTTTNGTVEQLWQIGQLEHDSPNMTQVERDHAIAQIALNTAAWLDPTGITGVVAAYTKPICKDVSAMTAQPAPAATEPTGGIAELMDSHEALLSNFTLQQSAAQAEYTSATALVTKLQSAYNSATGDAKTQLQAQLSAAQAEQQAAKLQLDKVTAARAQFAAVATKWDSVTASTGTTTATTPTPTLSWGETTHKAYDIAAGANGAVWFITAATQNGADGSIYRITSSGAQQVAGGAMRIAVDPAGNPWVVNSGNQIFRWNGSGWQPMPGAARDIGIGANGAVWVIGTDMSPYKWNGSNWSKISGGAVLISVDPSGNPWVVNASNQIYRYDGANWTLLPGAARDIGVGADGTVYVVGVGAVAGNSQVYRWVPSANNWTPESNVLGFSVAGGPAGTAYVARSRESGMPVLARIPR